MKIYIGSDHAGFYLKEKIITLLQGEHYDVKDLGAFSFDNHDDYPDHVFPVAQAVVGEKGSMGIVIGGSGQGEAIAANRVKGIRAAVFNGQYERNDGVESPDELALSRDHNDANILSLGARFLPDDVALEAVRRWLTIPFSGDERHVRRIEKLDREN